VTVAEDEVRPSQLVEFEGYIGIEWPPGGGSHPKPLPVWQVTPFNEDGPIVTVCEMTLHLDVTDLMWAEVTMFVDVNDRPVYRATASPLRLDENDKPVTGTFNFLITEMRMAGAPQG
jgi:hypothetical protein